MASLSLSSERISNLQNDQDDQVLFNEVVATLNDLGHYNRLTNKYQLNLNDHSVCLRDLIRFLRNDGQNFLVRRQMGLSNIVDNDLLPIIEQHTLNNDFRIDESGKSLMDKIIRLLVDLTNPTVLHYPNQKIPKDDKYEMNIYMELQAYLFQYKLAFSSRKRFWIVITKFWARILELNPDDRQVDDEMMMERIIILIRNVLHIPIITMRNNRTDDLNVHDRIVEHMNDHGMLDIILYMINNSEEYGQYCFHMLEIIFLIFREQNAEFIAKSVESDRKNDCTQTHSSNIRSQYEQEIDIREFEEARIRDQKEREKIMAKFKNDDFTRFRETAFIVKNMKAVSDRDMICYRAYSNPEKALDFNKNKIAQRRPRNRRPMNESVGNSDSFGAQQIHRSTKQLRYILYDFCEKFLSESYNKFMAEIRSNLLRGSSQEHDETYFFWACQFFMEFNRCQINVNDDREKRYQHIYETLSTNMFHYIQTIVDNYMDHLVFNKEFKNQIVDWSKRLHQALRSYRELLFSLSYIESLNLPTGKKMCYRIKNDIFTEPEYREMLLRLMQAYNEEKMSKAYLRDLIETNHIFLKMLDYHAKISLDFKIKIKKRKKSKSKRINNNNNNKTDNNDKVDDDDDKIDDDHQLSPDLIWMEIIDDVSEALNSQLNSQSILDDELLKSLFDPLSDRTLDEQKLAILRMIQKFLREKNAKKAVCLYREARNALFGVDEENVFGDIDIQIDDEMLALNGILMTELPKEKCSKDSNTENNNQNDDNDNNDNNETLSDEAEDSMIIQEKKFSINETIMRYAHPNTVRACRLLLKNYRTNSSYTNHAIVRLLYRIAVDLKMKPMFYNLGYFIIFEQIMDDQSLKNVSDKNCAYYKSICELATFSQYIIRSFFKLLSKHPKIASEICFIVNSREAYQMEYGFDNDVVTKMIREKKGLSWSDEQKLELEVLYNEYKDKTTKENDIVDLIQQHLIDDCKTRRQIIIQLKKMNLLSATELKKNSYKGPSWSSEEMEELKNLYEKFKDNNVDIMINNNDDNDNVEQQNKLTTTIVEIVESDKIDSVSDDNNKKSISTDKKKKLDIIDYILKDLSTSSYRNRRQIIRQLKIMGIYDHSMKNKWPSELIEELRTIFCDLFIDFKQSYDEMQQQNDDIVTKKNFIDKLMQKFSDKTKSSRQIIRQLHKMDFEAQLKSIELENSSKNNDIIGDDSEQELEQDVENNDIEDYDDDGEVVRQYEEDEEDETDVPNDSEKWNNKDDEDKMVKKRLSFSKIQFNSSDSEEENVVEEFTTIYDALTKRKLIESDDEQESGQGNFEMNAANNKKRRMVILDDDDE